MWGTAMPAAWVREVAANSHGTVIRFPQEREVPVSPWDTGYSRPCPTLPTPGAIEARWLPATPVVGFLLRA